MKKVDPCNYIQADERLNKTAILVISPEKGKPFERAGRKAMGSKSEMT